MVNALGIGYPYFQNNVIFLFDVLPNLLLRYAINGFGGNFIVIIALVEIKNYKAIMFGHAIRNFAQQRRGNIFFHQRNMTTAFFTCRLIATQSMVDTHGIRLVNFKFNVVVIFNKGKYLFYFCVGRILSRHCINTFALLSKYHKAKLWGQWQRNFVQQFSRQSSFFQVDLFEC